MALLGGARRSTERLEIQDSRSSRFEIGDRENDRTIAKSFRSRAEKPSQQRQGRIFQPGRSQSLTSGSDDLCGYRYGRTDKINGGPCGQFPPPRRPNTCCKQRGYFEMCPFSGIFPRTKSDKIAQERAKACKDVQKRAKRRHKRRVFCDRFI